MIQASRLMIAEFLEVTFSRHGTCKLLYDTSLALARSSPTRRYTGYILAAVVSVESCDVKGKMVWQLAYGISRHRGRMSAGMTCGQVVSSQPVGHGCTNETRSSARQPTGTGFSLSVASCAMSRELSVGCWFHENPGENLTEYHKCTKIIKVINLRYVRLSTGPSLVRHGRQEPGLGPSVTRPRNSCGLFISGRFHHCTDLDQLLSKISIPQDVTLISLISGCRCF